MATVESGRVSGVKRRSPPVAGGELVQVAEDASTQALPQPPAGKFLAQLALEPSVEISGKDAMAEKLKVVEGHRQRFEETGVAKAVPLAKRKRADASAPDKRLCSPVQFSQGAAPPRQYMFVRPVQPMLPTLPAQLATDLLLGKERGELSTERRREWRRRQVAAAGGKGRGRSKAQPADKGSSKSKRRSKKAKAGQQPSPGNTLDAADLAALDMPTKGLNPLAFAPGGCEAQAASEEAESLRAPDQATLMRVPRPPVLAQLEEYLGFVQRSYYSQSEAGRSSSEAAVARRSTLGQLLAPLRPMSVVDRWSPYEIAVFESAIALFGKDMHTIAQLIKTKSPSDVVEFYYVWKQTSHYKRWKTSFRPPPME